MAEQMKMEAKRAERFADLLTGNQQDLYAFVCVLLGRGRDEARDILQETNLMLIKHQAEYDHERAFMPWAKAFAYNQVRRFIKSRERNRLLFDVDLVERVRADTEEEERGETPISELLEFCLRKLRFSQRQLIEKRYYDNCSVADLAATMGCTASALSVRIHRIRQTLGDCIRKGLESELAPRGLGGGGKR